MCNSTLTGFEKSDKGKDGSVVSGFRKGVFRYNRLKEKGGTEVGVRKKLE